MNVNNTDIVRWITHFDTIWDLFKNPILVDFVLLWYTVKNNWEKLDIWQQWWKTMQFNSNYYEFIRTIFSSQDEINEFQEYIRTQVLEDKHTKVKIMRHIPRDSVLFTLLAFDEIRKQLNENSLSTIWSIFQIKITEMLSHWYQDEIKVWEIQLWEDVEDLYLSIVELLESTLQNKIMPLNEIWEVILFIREGTIGNIVKILSIGDQYEVDRYGNNVHSQNANPNIEMVASRKQAIKRIQQYKDIIGAMKQNIVENMSHENQTFYLIIREYFEEQTQKKDIPYNQQDFLKYVTWQKTWLEQNLCTMFQADYTQIDIWDQQWIEPGVQKNNVLVTKNTRVLNTSHKRSPQLKVVK